MSKIAITADPHFHNFSEFARIVVCPITKLLINSRLADQIATFWKMAQNSRKLGCQYLVLIGDLFHVRGNVPVDVIQAVYTLFERIKEELGIVIYVSTGNHDQVDLAGKVHGVYAFKRLVHVIDDVSYWDIGGTSCVFIPYVANHDELLGYFENVGVHPNHPVDLLLAHCGVDGAYVGPIEYKIKDPLTVKDIKPERFKWVILGHYHKPQMMAKNVLYVGSPAQINRGEAGEKKRWLVYNSANSSLKSYRTGAKEFRRITSSEWVADIHEDHYYDVVEDEQTPLSEARDALHAPTPVKFIPRPKNKVQDARLKLKGGMTDREVLSKYINFVGESPKLITLGLKLLSETVSGTGFSLTLKHLKVQNFMTLVEANVALDRPGSVIALLGANESADGFTSNGAGKSALLPESILWCLWGLTARELPADKVVNRFEKRDCEVTLEFTNHEGSEVSVTRYRKHKKYGANGLILIKDGVDITQGTGPLTQALLDSILGVDWTTFTSVIAFSQDSLRFVQAGDGDRKHVLDAILQTQRYASAKQLADNGVTNLERQLSARYMEINKLEDRYLQGTALLENYSESNKYFLATEADRVSSLKEQIREIDDEYATQTDILARANERIADIEVKLDIDLPDTEATQLTLVKASEAVATVTTELRVIEQQIAVLDSKIDAALAQAGKPCPTCGQPVSNTGKLIVHYNREKKLQEHAQARKYKERIHLQSIKEMSQNVHKEAQVLHGNYVSYKDTLNAVSRTRNTTQANMASLRRDKKRLEDSIQNTPQNPFPGLIEKLKKEMETVLSSKTALDTEQTKQTKLQEKFKFWQVSFGAKGIPLFLLEQNMPLLTEFANDLAYKLTGGSLSIEFTTHTDSGADKFRIHAYNEDGSDVYAGNSSGEKRRIDLCIMLALFQLAHATTKLNILLLDEALDTLDVGGLDAIVELLNTFAKELDLTIYVTSHTDLNNRLFESITVHKQNKRSTCLAL